MLNLFLLLVLLQANIFAATYKIRASLPLVSACGYNQHMLARFTLAFIPQYFFLLIE